MDHRISKDMISSGMIPSGKKNQEYLSRTQYGTAPSPNALADVYKSMYETKEEVINEHHKKDADGNTIPHEGEEIKEGKMPEGLKNYLMKKGKKEEVDFKPVTIGGVTYNSQEEITQAAKKLEQERDKVIENLGDKHGWITPKEWGDQRIVLNKHVALTSGAINVAGHELFHKLLQNTSPNRVNKII